MFHACSNCFCQLCKTPIDATPALFDETLANTALRAIVRSRYATCKRERRRRTMVTFKKILFPKDFSPNADRALTHAIRLADFSEGEVIVQHVVSDYFERHPHWATMFDISEMHKFMDAYAKTHVAGILPKDIGKVRV